MGQMSSSVPPAVLQSLQMYGENKAQSANLAQRGAMHRDEMELQAAQFEAKVRMEQQGLEFQKQQAEQQNEMAKAQLADREKDRALTEKTAANAERFGIKMKKLDMDTALAKLVALGASDEVSAQADDVAAEQERQQYIKSQAAGILTQIPMNQAATNNQVLKEMEDLDMVDKETLTALGSSVAGEVDDVDTSLFAEGGFRLDRDKAWKVATAGKPATDTTPPEMDTGVGAKLLQGVNAAVSVVGVDPLFNPEVKDQATRLPVVMKAVESRVSMIADRVAPLVADSANAKIAAGAIKQAAMAAATLSAVARNSALSGQYKEAELDGLRKLVADGVAAAEKAGVSKDEQAMIFKTIAQKQLDIFGGAITAGKEKAASGGEPDKATMALNSDAQAFMRGMYLAVQSAGVQDLDKKFKDNQQMYREAARIIAYEQDGVTVATTIANLPTHIREKVGSKAVQAREMFKLGQLDDYQRQVQDADLKIMELGKKGRGLKRQGEKRQAQAEYDAIAKAMGQLQ